MRVLVLGGTGLISGAIVKRLLAENHEPVAVNRGSRSPVEPNVETIVADKSDRPSFVERMKLQKADAVIDMISFNAEDVKTTLDAFGDNTEHIVVCSTVAAYRRPYASMPVREDAEALHDDPAFAYAFNKAEMERVVQDAWRERKMPVTVIRPSLTFGVGAANLGTLRQNFGIVDRIRRGKPLVVFGDGVHCWSFSFAPDVARAFVGVLGKRASFGQAYHATNEERTVWKDLYVTFGRLVGRDPELVHIPSKYLMEAAPEWCSHLYYEKSYDGLFDNDKLRSVVPGFTAEITLEQGLSEILEWWGRTGAAVDPVKDRAEDALVEQTMQLRKGLSTVFA